MLKRYKNAKILKQFDQEIFMGDIVTENGKVVYVGPSKDFGNIDTLDLCGKTIIPAFCNYDCNFSSLSKNEIDEKIKDNISSGVTKIVAVCDDFVSCKELCNKYGLNFELALPFDKAKNCKCIDEHMRIYVDPIDTEEKTLDDACDFCAKNHLKFMVKLFDNLERTGKLNSSKNTLPINYLEDFGILDRGGTLLGAIWADKEDFSLLANYDFDVVIRPLADLRKGNGFSNIIQIQNAGLHLGVGSDDEKDVDLFKEGRALLFGTRGLLCDENATNEKEVMKILTNEGQIKVNSQASFIVLNREFSNVQEIINFANKTDVLMTIIGENEIIKGEK